MVENEGWNGAFWGRNGVVWVNGVFLSEPEFIELRNYQNFGNSANSFNSGSDKCVSDASGYRPMKKLQ